MTFCSAANTREIGLGQVKKIKVKNKFLAIVNYDGEFFAADNTCTHEECDLGEGELIGSKLTCPCHGGQFEIKTGEAVSLPAILPIKIYKTRITGEILEIDIAEE
jgi:nitrite reductase/ring-hydroxylating ferredoxin subunit